MIGSIYRDLVCRALVCAGLLVAGTIEAQPFFEDATEGIGAPLFGARGMAFGDYDNDGWPDLFLTESVGQQRRIELLHNDGNGKFSARTTEIQADINPEEKGGGPLFGDIDNDGDLDLFVPVGSWSPKEIGQDSLGNLIGQASLSNFLLRNDRGVLTDIAVEAGIAMEEPTDNALLLDYDRDGLLDLFVGQSVDSTGAVGDVPSLFPTLHNRLLRNMGDGAFADMTAPAGLDERLHRGGGSNGGMAAGDFDNDGWPDLYLGVRNGANRLFLNEGNGHFRDATTSEVADTARAFGVAAGDIDNDGDLDLIQVVGGGGELTARVGFRAKALQNLGGGEFLDVTEGIGLAALTDKETFGPALGDIDNDGDLDLLVGSPFTFFLNNGDGTFVERTQESGVSLGGLVVALGDYDLDGFLDAAFGHPWPVQQVVNTGRLYRNRGNDNHWLRVELVGIESNRDGIGARLVATVGALQQTRELLGGMGFNQDEMVVHFGLGERQQVARLEIRWPSGQVDVVEDISADQKIRVFERRSAYEVVRPDVWESPPPAALTAGETMELKAVLRPALFEAGAEIATAVADLSGLGGGPAVPLQAQADGTYLLETVLAVTSETGKHKLAVLLEQNTSLGLQWSQMSRGVEVRPAGGEADLPVFAEGGALEWRLDLPEGLTASVDADAPVYRGGQRALTVSAAGLWNLGYRAEAAIPAADYRAVRFAFHPGTAARAQSAAEEPRGKIAIPLVRDDNMDIYAMQNDGSDLVRLTRHIGDDTHPSWSPDGGRIAFTSRRSGNADIHIMDADGGNIINLTSDLSAQQWLPRWSPNGERIAYMHGFAKVYTMSPDGGDVVQLTQDGFSLAVDWSLDSERLLLESDRDGNAEFYVLDVDSGELERLTENSAHDDQAAWSPDGEHIVFTSDRQGGHREIYTMDSDCGTDFPARRAASTKPAAIASLLAKTAVGSAASSLALTSIPDSRV